MKGDRLIYGVLLGAIPPLLAFLSIYWTLIPWVQHKPAILYAIAFLINLLMMRYFYSRQLGKRAQGVILITFIIVIFAVSLGELKLGPHSY